MKQTTKAVCPTKPVSKSVKSRLGVDYKKKLLTFVRISEGNLAMTDVAVAAAWARALLQSRSNVWRERRIFAKFHANIFINKFDFPNNVFLVIIKVTKKLKKNFNLIFSLPEN